MPAASIDLKKVIGRSPDRLSLDERHALFGKFMALEVYSPATLPLRRIEAVGDSIAQCVSQLTARGLDPRHYEFVPFTAPYPG